MVDLYVALIVVVVVLGIQQEIIGNAGPAGQRIQAEIALHDRVNARRGNAIAGEGIADARASRVSPRRIGIENCGDSIENPGSQIGGRHGENTREALADPGSLIVGKEERAVMAVVKAGGRARAAPAAPRLVLL